MPILGADMSAGTLIAWRKQPGDRVQRGDIVAEVETDKGLIDVEVFASGVIEKLLVQPGETVPTGAVLAIIREEAGVPDGTAVAAPPPPPRVRISPAARRRADQLGVDAATLQGTGPDGVITREDVERAAAARPAAPAGPGLAGRWTARRGCGRRSRRPWPARSARSRTTT